MTKIEEFSQAFTAAVQDAFVKVYGPPSREEHLQSIRPSWSEVSIKQGWHDPDPRVVVVGTEHGWVQDPYSSTSDHSKWEKAMKILEKEGWEDVHWESINPAVHTVYIDLPQPWHAVLTKRAMERGSRQR